MIGCQALSRAPFWSSDFRPHYGYFRGVRASGRTPEAQLKRVSADEALDLFKDAFYGVWGTSLINILTLKFEDFIAGDYICWTLLQWIIYVRHYCGGLFTFLINSSLSLWTFSPAGQFGLVWFVLGFPLCVLSSLLLSSLVLFYALSSLYPSSLLCSPPSTWLFLRYLMCCASVIRCVRFKYIIMNYIFIYIQICNYKNIFHILFYKKCWNTPYHQQDVSNSSTVHTVDLVLSLSEKREVLRE